MYTPQNIVDADNPPVLPAIDTVLCALLRKDASWCLLGVPRFLESAASFFLSPKRGAKKRPFCLPPPVKTVWARRITSAAHFRHFSRHGGCDSRRYHVEAPPPSRQGQESRERQEGTATNLAGWLKLITCAVFHNLPSRGACVFWHRSRVSPECVLMLVEEPVSRRRRKFDSFGRSAPTRFSCATS